ncbi:MAG TPA: hypothetical protein VKG25_13145, partial [Bryobacteraceae bacterium]|nr:hypothetical protein [Bryobacteraceae bacterium]
DKNAAYAARFLARLKGQTGSWTTAIADYHSALPDLGLPYQRLVLAAWKRMGNLPFNLGADVQEASYIPLPDTVAIIQSAAAKRIHVYTSSQPMDAAWHPGLPHVYEGD